MNYDAWAFWLALLALGYTVFVDWRSKRRDDQLRAEAEAREKRGHEQAEIDARVQRVVDRYIYERTERGAGPSLNTLRDAGVDHLRSDAEVRQVIRRVGELAPPSPIQELEKDLQDADLMRLFRDTVTPEGRISMTPENVRKLAARQRESR